MSQAFSEKLPVLQQQLAQAWTKFNDRHPNATEVLSPEQLIDFKRAIALSDFVLAAAIKSPELVIELFLSEAVNHHHLPDYQAELNQALLSCQSEEQLQRLLRIFRLKHMVQIAIADLVFDCPLSESLARLSQLADALILGALEWLTAFCVDKWGQPQDAQGNDLPLLVYGMGKLGGMELNFSSDIDLILTFPAAGTTHGTRRTLDNQQFFIRLGQKLIAALNQPTVDGFVYRVDMRLRPFGDSGPLVMNFNAMEDYYQEQGRDWERYAMLKARLIGDGKYHRQLADTLRPFVYRRYIDFSVFDSLRRMKMLIAQEVRRKQLTNNIKLGAGGIREIEFIVQVFQLIRGGRVQELQQRNLLTVLPLLVKHQLISAASMEKLSGAYQFLRRVENAIQAFNDQQTQTLPDTELGQQRLLWVLKVESWSKFTEQLQQHMEAVHQEFKGLIGEDSPNHEQHDQHWQQLWHYRDADDEGLALVEQLAPNWQSEAIWHQLKYFHQEVAKRGIGQRGQQVLDKLMPLLLAQLYQQDYKAQALERALLVLSKIITRTAYLELLYENVGALKHLLRLCHESAWVAEHIAKFPILLDELLDPQLLHNPPSLASYREELREIMLRVPEDDLELQMETLRQFKQAKHLRIAASDIVGVLPVDKVSAHLSAVAEAIIQEVVHLSWQQMSLRYGVPSSTEGADHLGFAVIGYGKAGGHELGYGSDLDLVFLHQSDAQDMTNGERVVPASQFYVKMAQRIMHFFNTRMTSGILYELDMRLRPSGNSGLLVVHVDTFAQYQQQEAWTWEHQALVRARVIFGHQQLAQRFEQARKDILVSARDLKQLKTDVIEMREKMRNHLDKSTDEQIDIKQGEGGLVDIEFLAQFLVLAFSHQYPVLSRYSDNEQIFAALVECGIISDEQQRLLVSHYGKLRDLGHSAVLQNRSSNLFAREQVPASEEIISIWQTFLA